jgi:energy-coupling factor transporter ATP-binding protein EcfA2
MPITNLHISGVGPFDEITFDFDQQLNVFTGPNNSGKSTALWVLGELLVYPFSMPNKLLWSDDSKWLLSFSTEEGVQQIRGDFPSNVERIQVVFEAVGYTCFVPAQRLGTNFRSSGPTVSQDINLRIEKEIDQFAQERPNVLREAGPETLRRFIREGRVQEGPELANRTSLMLSGTSLVSDEAVIQKIVDLDYAAYRLRKPAMRSIVEKVASIASEITDGFSVEFLGVGEDDDGLFPQLRTPDGELSLNVLSQGTQSIIQCLARVLFGYAEYYDFPTDLEDKLGIIIIDEIDAHLHPSWQRRIIPTLTKHFPRLQIFCSTHSPLMLAGLKAGQVQLLRRDVKRTVTVSTNESDIAGWTADEILRNFLEVPSPTDMATAENISRLQELRHKDNLSDGEAEELEKLRKTVGQDLLSGPMSSQVEQFVEELERARNESTHSSGPPPSTSGGTTERREPRE